MVTLPETGTSLKQVRDALQTADEILSTLPPSLELWPERTQQSLLWIAYCQQLVDELLAAGERVEASAKAVRDAEELHGARVSMQPDPDQLEQQLERPKRRAKK